MKVWPNIFQRITVVFGLLFISATFISANLTRAQVNSTVSPVVGEMPAAVSEPFSPQSELPDHQIDATMALTATAYLPIIVSPDICNLNSQEQELADLAVQDPDQGRPFMNCDPILAQVARERALDMGTRNYFDHTNPDGFGPNYLVRQAGYVLPYWYGTADDANNIESIAAGPAATAATIWANWLNSAGHRAHVLGEGSFWASQTSYGVGYAYVPTGLYKHYWVFISAPPQE